MRVFGPIVQPFVAAMRDARHHFRLGCLVAAQLHPSGVPGDQHARHILATFEQFAEELLRLEGNRGLHPSGVPASALDQAIQHVPVLLDRPPQILRRPRDF